MKFKQEYYDYDILTEIKPKIDINKCYIDYSNNLI